MRRLHIYAVLGACACVACVALVAARLCYGPPAITLEHSGPSAVIVHVETLGEYPTTVRHIRIEDASSRKVVLELLTASGTPQIYSFRLSAGENSTNLADPSSGTYRVTVPVGKDTFTLQPGVRYRVTLWGDGWFASGANVKF
jgi:hypothetical protein